jgi:hypothetical protein
MPTNIATISSSVIKHCQRKQSFIWEESFDNLEGSTDLKVNIKAEVKLSVYTS